MLNSDQMRIFKKYPAIKTTKYTIAPLPVAVVILIFICVFVEFALGLADYGVIGSTRWRSLSYQNGAFWAGLLYNWQPNFTLQPWTMFVSYSFLHSGFTHLLGNMLALAWLGQIACERIGQSGFVALYIVSAIFGGLVFGIITGSAQPMVGASGALFGLAGAWQCWIWQDYTSSGKSLKPIFWTLLLLVALNFFMWLSANGQLAWETHLGGFIAGSIFAFFKKQNPKLRVQE